MNVDAIWYSAMSVFVLGHLIGFLIDKGEAKQWKKDIEEKIESMQDSIKNFQETDTQQRMSEQKFDQFIEIFKEHMLEDKAQFKTLGDKIDKSFEKLFQAVIKNK